MNRPIKTRPWWPSDPNLVVAGDFNDDGKLDLIALSEAYVSILLGNGDGTFQAPKPLPFGDGSVDFGPDASAVAGDFNGDGRTDLVIGGIGDDGGGEITVMLGNGDGTFQPGGTAGAAIRPDRTCWLGTSTTTGSWTWRRHRVPR